MSSLIGIVTVLFNSDDVLPGFFQSLACQQDVRYRLYIIDNSKTDSGCQISRKLADSYGIDSIILFNDANVGVAKGNNQGVELALNDGCEYILLSNNDIEFDESFLLTKLEDVLASSNQAAVVPKIYYFNPANLIWYAGGRFSHLRSITPHQRFNVYDDGRKEPSRLVEYAPTCFILMKSFVFKKIGYFDERYFVYYDDSDFVLKLNKSGEQIIYYPDLFIRHKVSSSTGGGESDFTIFYITRNRLFFILKNYKGFAKLLALFYYFVRILLKWTTSSSSKRDIIKKAVFAGFELND